MPGPPHELTSLPAPSAEERAASARLGAVIGEEIAKHGPLPFSRFMELALYAPGLGYYVAGKEKLGQGGDFFTAAESLPLFGACLAHTAAEALERSGGREILEVGAGSGKLAAVLLNALGARGAAPAIYNILDVSAELRERQARTLRQWAPAHYERVRWLDRLPAPGFRGLVLANELLDAMPVERFRIDEDGVRQLSVDRRDDRFVWADRRAGRTIAERVENLDIAPGYVSEIGFAAEAWIRSVADMLAVGALLLVDYGFPRAEFYHPDRAAGTLMCHYRHRAHGDPLILVGLQDITAHVDFTAIAAAGTESGLDLLGYTSQAAFLIGNKLDEVAARSDPNDVRAHVALTNQIKKLTLPHEMGELFKVMALGRGIAPLSAFFVQDRRSRL